MTSLLPDHALIERLNWRYAVKRFDTTRKISSHHVNTLEQILVLSPSSYGLQPYRFFMIDDQALRTKLTLASYGQPQIMECSLLVIFTIYKNLDRAYVDRLIARTAVAQNVPVESLARYRQLIIGDLIDGPRHGWIKEWSARQAYLALGNLLTSAATLGIDACPMEGFDPAQYDEILALSPHGLSTVVVCALGYRSPEDRHAQDLKVRLLANELIEHR